MVKRAVTGSGAAVCVLLCPARRHQAEPLAQPWGVPPGLALPYVCALCVFSQHSTLHIARKILFTCFWFLSPRSPSHLTPPLPQGALEALPNALSPWGLCAAGSSMGQQQHRGRWALVWQEGRKESFDVDAFLAREKTACSSPEK